MPKKKNAAAKDEGAAPPVADTKSSSKQVVPAQQSQYPVLNICRNKHWRGISAFHGPWLQLPAEILETLAHTNYNTPRPRPIDPSVFFDVVKIRRLVDEATNLAVRATAGVASISQPQNSSRLELSRERKHRMREQATQKLARAYRLDEIATSVATMQGASSLEEVASLVVQRSAEDLDAKYVHFFHEKIPSRHLAECTSLDVLDEIIAARPTECESLRTRATVRIFKEDFQGAAADLTEALRRHRLYRPVHADTSLAEQEEKAIEPYKRPEDIFLKEDEQPSSLEVQLLYQRAGVYLTLASQHIKAGFADQLSKTEDTEEEPGSAVTAEPPTDTQATAAESSSGPEEAPALTEAQRVAMEARKLVRTYAKRALRDYMEYLSHLEYSPDLPVEVSDEFTRKVNLVANGIRIPRPHSHGGKPGSPAPGDRSNGVSSQKIYTLSQLFAATPPSDIPPYPSTDVAIVQPHNSAPAPFPTTMEALTYHPLLTDALHSLLLCHCLIQTSAKELLRHAYMVTRFVRIADGYPIFQGSRSPARADWVEVLRAGSNWIQLSGAWDDLCSASPLPIFQPSPDGSPRPSSLPPSYQPKALPPAPGQLADADAARALARLEGRSTSDADDRAERRRHDLIRHQAVLDALSDDRVGDEASFQRAVEARRRRAEEDAAAKADSPTTPGSPPGDPSKVSGVGKSNARPAHRRWGADDKDYPILSERATAVARWVVEAPPVGGAEGGTRRRKKKRGVRKV